MKKSGIIFILFTSNNVICSFTDLKGSVITWNSAGSQKSGGLKKTIPSIPSICVIKLAKHILKLGFSGIHLKLKGFNKTKKSVIKILQQFDLDVLSYQDLTALPHNGCRKPRKKRY